MSKSKFPFGWIPLSVPLLGEKEEKYSIECLRSGWISSIGPWVKRFEREFAENINQEKALSASSGTAALHLALLVTGVKPGDLVLAPTLTFIAPINAIRYVGAEPVFIDSDPFLNLSALGVKSFISEECKIQNGKLIHKKTKKKVSAVLAVHVLGALVNIAEIKKTLKGTDTVLIEDATEALGSYWLEGKKQLSSGTRGDIAAFSFNGNKIITTGGGGMLISQKRAWLEHAEHLSTQAKKDPVTFEHDEIGYNYRLTSLQSAVGIAQLETLSDRVKKKRAIHSLYEIEIAERTLGSMIGEPENTRSNFWLSAMRLPTAVNMAAVIHGMEEKGVEIRPLWKLNHTQKMYAKHLTWKIKDSTKEMDKVICLPSTPNLTQTQIEYITDSLDEVTSKLKNKKSRPLKREMSL